MTTPVKIAAKLTYKTFWYLNRNTRYFGVSLERFEAGTKDTTYFFNDKFMIKNFKFLGNVLFCFGPKLLNSL